MFPRYEDPDAYRLLARDLDDYRLRWFVLRCALSSSERDSSSFSRASLEIARLHRQNGRPDLALSSLRDARSAASSSDDESRAELSLLLEIERLFLGA
ncbi:MAG: hypothetical protein HC923_05690 [Myxococcales bacterium]|nr:hypothetical protein [Myxococcales bacterium]